MSATAVNDAAIVVLIVMSSPAYAVSGQNAVVSGYKRSPSDLAAHNRAEPLPGIFNIINEYREHKESTFAALMCVYRLVTNESQVLWRRYNSFG
jgi:hypothetical protein